jgi:conjugal transfer pilus assembly protein TraV
MKIKRFFILVMAIGFLSGCQTLNPYDKAGDCPDPYTGDCVSMKAAYRRSRADPENSDPRHDSPLIKDRAEKNRAATPVAGQGAVYRRELYQEIAGLVKQPITPVRIPAKQMRVLILGYDREDRFYSQRYIIFESDKPRCILDIMED